MADINLWSVDAENNNMTPPHGWPEGMNYSAVNDAARESMAAIKRWFDDISGKLDATGQANLYAVTLNAGYSSYFRGMAFRCKIPATNTGASTINVNAIGPRNIVRADGSALKAGMLQQGHAYSFYFDGTNFRVDATTLVPDAALSDNIPKLNASNTFTAQNAFIGSHETDTRILRSNTSGSLVLAGGNANSSSAGGRILLRGIDTNNGEVLILAGNSGNVQINGSTIDINGDADVSGELSWGGGSSIDSSDSVVTTLSRSNFDIPNVFRFATDDVGFVDFRIADSGEAHPNVASAGGLLLALSGPGFANSGLTIGRAVGGGDDDDNISLLPHRGSVFGSPTGGPRGSGSLNVEALYADSLDINGNADISGTLSWGGGNPISSSNNVALLDASNVFDTGGTAPRIGIQRDDNLYTFNIDSGGALRIVRQAGEGVNTVRIDAGFRSGSLTVDGEASIGGTISGNGSGLTSLNASNISSGTVPDARLSSNVPRLNAANTFTKSGAGLGSAAIAIVADTPNFVMHETDQGEDGGLWVFSLASGQFRLGAVPDNYSGSISNSSLVLNATRSGANITSTTIRGGAEIELNADLLNFNGAARAGTAATSTSSTLAAGQIHHRSSNTTVPNLGAGRWVAVQNTGTSSITLSQGSGVTLELGGTTMTGNRTLLAKGFAFIYFRANGVGVVHGSGVT